MGLKSGSRDAGLDDGDEEQEAERKAEDGAAGREATDDDDRDRTAASGDASDSSSAPGGTDRDESSGRRGSTESADAGASASASRSARESETDRSGGGSIPYKLRRDKVNDGREQVPYFLREGVIDAEDDLQDALEAMLGEDVYKSDYREASMVVAQRNPELVAEVLREWGYDYDFD